MSCAREREKLSLLTTPTMRRQAVAHILASAPPGQVGLLRLRLHREAELMNPGGCVICWQPRLDSQMEERRDRPVETCGHPRCSRLWFNARQREVTLHQRAKVSLLAEASHAA